MKEIILKESLNSQTYDKINLEEMRDGELIFLGVSGSRGYGLETPKSDLDLRGVCLEGERVLYGLSSPNQVNSTKTDTEIYSFKHYMSLLAKQNPNMLELLGIKEEEVAYSSPQWSMLVKHKNMFLTSRIYDIYKGYSKSLDHQIKKRESSIGYSDSYTLKLKAQRLRILNMGTELLESQEINTRRSEDRELLKEIRLGNKLEVYDDIIRSAEDNLLYAKEHTILPSCVDIEEIEDLMIEIYKMGSLPSKKLEILLPDKISKDMAYYFGKDYIQLR